MAKKRPSEQVLLKAAFDMIEADGWQAFSLTGLADRAEISLPDLYRIFSRKSAVLAAVGRNADLAMLAADRAELADMPVRDRLFELIMRRLDALGPYRGGLRAMAEDARCDPCLTIGALCRVERATGWMADMAGMDARALRGVVARKVLGAVYAQVFRIWLDDDTEDGANTLAELDRRLGQAEALARFGRRRKTQADTAEQAA